VFYYLNKYPHTLCGTRPSDSLLFKSSIFPFFSFSERDQIPHFYFFCRPPVGFFETCPLFRSAGFWLPSSTTAQSFLHPDGCSPLFASLPFFFRNAFSLADGAVSPWWNACFVRFLCVWFGYISFASGFAPDDWFGNSCFWKLFFSYWGLQSSFGGWD